ncbi:hypothetical protein [Sorangium sp. So ce887]|uniref:hypothetical protein n=1 Tax=Sorangium sp. So ce887 TaxID=3133324 RepID=UPI003F63DC26
MADHVVDTNVLIVASAADPASPFKDTHVPANERRIVFAWLRDFRGDHGRRLIMDRARGLLHEYKKKLTAQDYGLVVAMEKLRTAAFVSVEYDGEYAVVPEGLARFDNSDKKLVAAHLAHRSDGGQSTIVNACDTDWHEHEEALSAEGVIVEQLLPGWCQREFWRKHPEKVPLLANGRERGVATTEE